MSATAPVSAKRPASKPNTCSACTVAGVNALKSVESPKPSALLQRGQEATCSVTRAPETSLARSFVRLPLQLAAQLRLELLERAGLLGGDVEGVPVLVAADVGEGDAPHLARVSVQQI